MCQVRGLGGKLGDTVVSQLGVETMGQLAALSLRQIAAKFEEKTAQWLHSLGTGRSLYTLAGIRPWASDRLPPSLKRRLHSGSIHLAQVGACSPWQANSHLGQLVALSLRQITAKFEQKTAQWLFSHGTGGNLSLAGIWPWASDRLPLSLKRRLHNGSIHLEQVGASLWQEFGHEPQTDYRHIWRKYCTMASFTWHRWELVVPGRNLALSLRQITAKFEEKTAQWLHSLGTGRSCFGE